MPTFVHLLAADDVLRDITGPEFLPPPPTAEVGRWIWIGIGVALALGILVLIRVLPLRRSRKSTAAARALKQLDRLHRFQLLQKNRAERHFTLLALILRRFIDKTTDLAASRMTTAELLNAAANVQSLAPHVEFLREFLPACDIAKFAPRPAVADLDRDLDRRLREWLRSTESHP